MRELFNLMERLLILAPQRNVTKADLPEQFFRQPCYRQDKSLTVLKTAELVATDKRFDLKEHLSQLELDLITAALQDTRGVVARAAKKLGLRRTTLVEKMKKYGIGRELNYKTQGEAG